MRPSVALLCVLLLPLSAAFAQTPTPPPGAWRDAPQGAQLAPEQLDNLVAPVALYPDPVLSTVLAASTYPLEVVEALQWYEQQGSMNGGQLMEAAKQQNWDSSVQALIAFPDALRLLGHDV